MALSKPNICIVTGAAGFIGSHLCDRLLELGFHVRGIDNFFSGKQENIEHLKSNQNFELVEADVTRPSSFEKAFDGVQVVFHQAALGSVALSIEDPDLTYNINVMGTLNVLNASLKYNVSKLVLAASCAAYGLIEHLPISEKTVPYPLSPYAASKLAQEHLCIGFANTHRLKTICLRYFNVYGPRQDPNSQYGAVIPKFFSALIKKQSPVIYGDGEQTRDFVFVKDVVRANVLAMENPNVNAQTFNVCSQDETSVNTLFAMISKTLNSDVCAKHVYKRPGEVERSLGVGLLAHEVLGFKTQTPLNVGLEQTKEFYIQTIV